VSPWDFVAYLARRIVLDGPESKELPVFRIATAISGFVALIAGFIAGAPASFASRLPLPSDGDAAPSATRLAHHGGLTSLDLALIVVVAVVVLAAVGMAVVQLRRRPIATPALSQ
jgi:hypothetical protein